MSNSKQIFIKMPRGNTLTFTINNCTNIENLKKFIFKRTNLPSTWQRFIYCGKSFYKNELNLTYDLNIQKESTIHVMLKFHGVGCSCKNCLSKNILLRNGKRI
jgi:hypothetical protein